MEFTSVFDEATRDHEAEARDLRLTAASIDAQAVWPFLADAESLADFGNRVALREDTLSAIAARHGVSWDDVVGPLERGFEVLRTTAGKAYDPDCRQCVKDDPSLYGKDKGTYAAAGRTYTGTCEHDGKQASLQSTAGLECRRCNHANGPHEQGQVCTCGCTTFTPKSKTSKKEHEDDRPDVCSTCGGAIRARESSPHNKGTHWDHVGNGPKDGHTPKKASSQQKTAKPWEWRTEPGDSMGRGQYHLSEWSDECKPNGSGQCDGFKEDSHSECGCPCHSDWDLPQTVKEVKDWHDEMHDVPKGGTKESARKTAETDSTGAEWSMPVNPYSHGDNAEDHAEVPKGPSYDPASIHDLFLNGTKSNPVFYYNQGYEHGQAGAEYHGYGGRDAAILYGHGYRHGKADSKAPQVQASWQGHLATLRMALMEGADPLEWIQAQNPPGGPQYAEVPSGHDEVQRFPADGTTGGKPDALDQALKQGSLTQEGGGPF